MEAEVSLKGFARSKAEEERRATNQLFETRERRENESVKRDATRIGNPRKDEPLNIPSWIGYLVKLILAEDRKEEVGFVSREPRRVSKESGSSSAKTKHEREEKTHRRTSRPLTESDR